MTQGFLLFAHNNERISYVQLAAWQAKRINKWLGKSVSIVTDQQSLDTLTDQSMFDHIILSEVPTSQQRSYNGNKLTFNNTNRCCAFDLTPYDETIIIDTDIVIQSDRLNLLWNSNQDMLFCKHSHDVFDRNFVDFQYLHPYGIEFFWATITYFRKTDISNLFFESCKRIKQNYQWYANSYGVQGNYIRNDHLWSIAIHELGLKDLMIPSNLYHTLETDSIIKITNDSITVANTQQISLINGSDVHAMNKFDLILSAQQELLNE